MDERSKIIKTVVFLDAKLRQSDYFVGHPQEMEYRFEHSMRVANIGREIAEKEGLNVLNMTLGCILHDVAYCLNFDEANRWEDHGRASAQIARPYLCGLGIAPSEVEEICYGIAIHVDGRSDFEGEKTPLALSINDADNIDRFDAYRIYDGLKYRRYDDKSLADKRIFVEATLKKLKEHRMNPAGTPTARRMLDEKIDYQTGFYNRLLRQIDMSSLP